MSTTHVLFRKLVSQPNESVEDILRRAATYLQGMNETAMIEIRLVGVKGSDGASTYALHLTPSAATVEKKTATKPALTAVMAATTFHRLVEGTYSPIQAYMEGRMKFMGDAALGRRLIQSLATPGAAPLDQNPLITSTWQFDGITHGSVVTQGQGFTPLGLVDIHYDWGGGFYRKGTTADANGCFKVTEPAFPCGGKVSITAYDLDGGGKKGMEEVPTPCHP